MMVMHVGTTAQTMQLHLTVPPQPGVSLSGDFVLDQEESVVSQHAGTVVGCNN
jgi:hypothetical protein